MCCAAAATFLSFQQMEGLIASSTFHQNLVVVQSFISRTSTADRTGQSISVTYADLKLLLFSVFILVTRSARWSQ